MAATRRSPPNCCSTSAISAPAASAVRPDKDVRHLELSLEGSGLHYEPGDALGVWPRNPPALVDAVLPTLQLDGDDAGQRTAARRCRCGSGWPTSAS